MSAPVPDVKAAPSGPSRSWTGCAATKEASLEAWQEHVRAYVLERFLLDREEEEEGIIPLAQKSVEKLTGIPRETLAAADRPSGCTAATAVLDKKVLLILSLCKGLSVTIPVGGGACHSDRPPAGGGLVRKGEPVMNREDFPLLADGKWAYLDNAATTQRPQPVLDALAEAAVTCNANVHRSPHGPGPGDDPPL